MFQKYSERELKLFDSLVKLEIERYEELVNTSSEFLNPDQFNHKIMWLKKIRGQLKTDIKATDRNKETSIKLKLHEAKMLLSDSLLPLTAVTDDYQKQVEKNASNIVDLIFASCIEYMKLNNQK